MPHTIQPRRLRAVNFKRLTQVTCALILACSTLAIAPSATAAPGPRVAIIIPGQGMGVAPYLPLVQSVQLQGYQTEVLDLAGLNLRADARAIERRINGIRHSQPASSVALIGHSVGGLSARYYLKVLGGASYVDTYVAIGTPQYGAFANCSAPMGQYICFRSPFLEALNTGTDSPGPTHYYSIRSQLEYSDGRLDGGQCRTAPTPATPGTDGAFDHTTAPLNAGVWAAVNSSLAGNCAGVFVNEPDDSIRAEQTVRGHLGG